MQIGKRKTKVDAKSTDGDDVESQKKNSAPNPRTRPPTSPRGPTGGMLRKLMLLTARDMDTDQSNYLLTIIKDVISGTILGVVFLMILIFLDYRNIVQLGSARAFRRAAFELMTDPETVKTIEESIDVKFVPVDVYKSMDEEIKRNQDKIKDNTSLAKHEADLKVKLEEIAAVKVEATMWKAKGDAILGLDKWCGGCKAGWGNCQMRVVYLRDTYHSSEIESKVNIMKEGKCLIA